MKPRRPIPRQSKKRTTEARQYVKAKKVFLSDHPTCFVCGSFVSPEKRDLHHWAKRAGKLYLEEKLWMCLCRDCHLWVHDDESRAQEFGWLAPKGCCNDYKRAMLAFDKRNPVGHAA